MKGHRVFLSFSSCGARGSHWSTKLCDSLCIPVLREAYRDRRLTTNFELWVEIFCVPTCFHVRIPKPCPSVCPYPEKRNHLSFVNISPTLVIDTSMERSSRVLQHGNPKISKKFKIDEIEFCPYPELPYAGKRNRPGFVNITPTLVIDTSMERSSRVLQHGNQYYYYFFFSKKFEIEFDLWWRAEISIQVGLNMHLYVDIGDASSSLWGSTSSFL